MSSVSDEDIVILQLIDPSTVSDTFTHEQTSISTSDIQSWDLPLLTSSRTIKVEASRSRLVEESSYFRGLLGGSFSESTLRYVTIKWNLEAVLSILQFIHGCLLNFTFNNFVLLLEGALFFGVENLLLECETWFAKIISEKELHSSQMPLDTILEIWSFGLEHRISFVPDQCEDYLARNFASVALCRSFADIPYDLLYSCTEKPQLAVESEKQLCEALLKWLAKNTKSSAASFNNSGSDYFDILKKVRVAFLPLGFTAGQRRHFLQFADEVICAILDLLKDHSSSLMHIVANDDSDQFRIRLTKFSEKVVLSGCTQMTTAMLFLGVLPYDTDAKLKTKIIHDFVELDHHGGDHYKILELNVMSFEGVREVDISKCSKVHSGATIIWLHLAFPSLRTLKASHCLQFKIEDLHDLIRACPLISEIDLTVDISPIIPTKASVLSVNAETYDERSYKTLKEKRQYLPKFENVNLESRMLYMSNISKLTLEGRNDINDMDLLYISSLSDSLSYLNIKGCTLVTDMGISKLISKCRKIDSLILSYTAFGRVSIMTLCSGETSLDGFNGVPHIHAYSDMMAFSLVQLHIDGCMGVDQNSMLQLMAHSYMLRVLSLRDTSLIDDALCEFMGSYLEVLDISETTVSMRALAYVIKRNRHLRCLKATGCRNLHTHECNDLTDINGVSFEDLFCELGKRCILEEVAFGWGFSSILFEKLKPNITKIRAMTLGLGAVLDHHTLYALPKICQQLESVILIFQVISDIIVRSILESLEYLQVLCLCCCTGDLTSSSFQIYMPNLRTLKLMWVTPWMTNADLATLASNCSNLVELSLSGCKLLDADSQEIISSGWPGLTLIHLEDCGKITLDGVSFLFNCKAVEDLLLRHNGRGIKRNFIFDAASKLPLLRKVALDLCDACEGGFDSPNHGERCNLSNVRLCRCKSQKCSFDLQAIETFKSVHKETIVLEWNSKEMRTTVVKERI